jgi:ferredoxin-type protein NapG
MLLHILDRSNGKLCVIESPTQFLLVLAKMACGVGLGAGGLALYAKQARAVPPQAIRPPGALAERDFQGACIRCGMCVRDCPYKILDLAKPEDPIATGTPYFTARTGPCEMCEDIPCVKACPTGALDPGSPTSTRRAWAGGAGRPRDLPQLPRPALDVAARAHPRQAITLGQLNGARQHTLFIGVHFDSAGCGK